jgi:transcriptional regulator CtsR
MRKTLADRIEQYLKALIEHSADKRIEIQRIELAETFCCVPSQVTYVIATRFSYEHGYSTESRRGGQGYVRISKCEAGEAGEADSALLTRLDELTHSRLLSPRESELLKIIYRLAISALPRHSHREKGEMLEAALDIFLRAGQETPEDGGAGEGGYGNAV